MYLTVSFKLNTTTSNLLNKHFYYILHMKKLSILAKVITLVTGKAKIVHPATPIPELIYT